MLVVSGCYVTPQNEEACDRKSREGEKATMLDPFNLRLIELLIEQHKKDMARKVERDRLIRQARARHDREDSLHRQALAWLGCRLIAWGQRLQGRYDPVAETPCA